MRVEDEGRDMIGMWREVVRLGIGRAAAYRPVITP